jgi:hypothetical protein
MFITRSHASFFCDCERRQARSNLLQIPDCFGRCWRPRNDKDASDAIGCIAQ